eukprot:10679106-Ditylum_brightwellii.AAC.1
MSKEKFDCADPLFQVKVSQLKASVLSRAINDLPGCVSIEANLRKESMYKGLHYIQAGCFGKRGNG